MVERIKSEFTLRDWIYIVTLVVAATASITTLRNLSVTLKEGFDNHEGRITELERQEYIRQGREEAILDMQRGGDDAGN